MPKTELPLRRARTKIIATLGPACDDEATLIELLAAGADVFRLNTAHGDEEDIRRLVARIRHVGEQINRPIGILVDLAGPKIRLGQLAEEPLRCAEAQQFTLVRGETARGPAELTSNYESLIDELNEGDRVMLADGTVGMMVIEKTADTATLAVLAPGEIRSRQGINLPGAKLSIQSPTPRDLEFARLAAELNVELVSLSFVRAPAEIARLRNELEEAGSRAMIVAKIEKPEALEQLDAIVEAADAVMVARGDLGVEIDVAEIAAVQKRIIATCTHMRRPVIVATQMLESMRTARLPTRAEATDVANAILDGADACMLSGETAIGERPRDVVEMMNRIAQATEPLMAHQRPADLTPRPGDAVRDITLATVHGASQIASQLGAKLVVVATRSGATAIARAKQRDFVRSVGVSNDPLTLGKLCLLWGITPLSDAPVDNNLALMEYIDEWGKREGTLAPGDRVIHVSGTGLLDIVHDQVIVHEVG